MAVAENGQPTPTPASQGVVPPSHKAEEASYSTGAYVRPPADGGLVGLMSALNAPSVSPEIKPFLEKLLENLKASVGGASFTNVRCEHVVGSPNSFIIVLPSTRYEKSEMIFPLRFVGAASTIQNSTDPESKFIKNAVEAYTAGRSNQILVGSLIVLTRAEDMARVDQVTETIRRAFVWHDNQDAHNATASGFAGYELIVTTDEATASEILKRHSTTSTQVRIDVAMNVMLRRPRRAGYLAYQEQGDDRPIPLGSIGGYVDFPGEQPEFNPAQNTQVMRQKPLVYITAMQCDLPIAPVIAMLVSAFTSEVINNRRFWLQQYIPTLGGTDPIHPGVLAPDPQTNTPADIPTDVHLEEFASAVFADVDVAIQFQDGHDNLPHLAEMLNSASAPDFVRECARFFGVGEDLFPQGMVPTQHYRSDIEGVYGSWDGNLRDSRYIDFVNYASKHGLASCNEKTKTLLLRRDYPAQTRERALEISNIIANSGQVFRPLYDTSVHIVARGFVNAVTHAMSRAGVTITNPSAPITAQNVAYWQQVAGNVNVARAIGAGSYNGPAYNGGRAW
jgi:hypothetical protein